LKTTLPVAYEEVKKNKAYWGALDEQGREEYARKVFEYYRANGYPDFEKFEVGDIRKEVSKLLSKDFSDIIVGDVIRQTMHGLALCWSYFPHAKAIQNGNSPTPLDIFNDDELFMTAIRKRIKYGDNISDAGIRKALRKYGGVAVSNFRPSAACAIYNRYKPKTVYDMSAGFGGRLLGAYISNDVNRYIGVEPSGDTWRGLMAFFLDLLRTGLKDFDAHLYPTGSEDFRLKSTASVDMCFTSPPYFNTEKYSYEPTQSWIKFPEYGSWLNGYWKETLIGCKSLLRPSGILAFNVANIKSVPTLERDMVGVATDLGFSHAEKLQLQLSGRPHKTPDKLFKYEPIYVMKH